MNSCCPTLTALILALWAPHAFAQDSLAQMLEKGIYLEETAGNIEEAAQVYGQIVAKGKAEASLIAQAYYRLGTCQLKQNKSDQAAETFKQLIDTLPGETQWVRKARAELTRMEKGAAGPGVLRTNPPAFKEDVSPDLKEITVTFNQPMTDKTWSWTGGGDTFPESAGDIHYNSTRTVCTMPVKLEPGKVYWVGVNSPSNRNFKSARGVPVPWHVILFATADADGKPTAIPADMLERAKKINSASAKPAAESEPPLVVKTEPQVFRTDVPAKLDKIRVRFSRPMSDKSWSWTGGGDTFPEAAGEISFDSTKTECTKPVKLEPGKVYWVGINSPSHRNFKSADDVPAPWYVILFATADAAGNPTDIPEELLQQAKKINEAHQRQAKTQVRKVSPADKRKAEALAAEGWKIWQKQEFEAAEKAFQEAVQLDSSLTNAWNGLGWSQFNQGKPLNAREAFEKAVELDPRHAAALNGLGWVAKGQGETEQAIEHWKKAVAAAPNASAALNGLSGTYMELGEYQEAARYYQMWLKAEPNNEDAKAGLAKAREEAKSQN